MSSAFRGMAQEISHSLVGQMATRSTAERPLASGIVELLVQRLAEEVATQLLEDSGDIAPKGELGARLEDLERKLERLLGEEGDEDDKETNEGGSSLPNLKYAKPKYKDVDSVLKYIERDGEQGGVKLVIMNFND